MTFYRCYNTYRVRNGCLLFIWENLVFEGLVDRVGSHRLPYLDSLVQPQPSCTDGNFQKISAKPLLAWFLCSTYLTSKPTLVPVKSRYNESVQCTIKPATLTSLAIQQWWAGVGISTWRTSRWVSCFIVVSRALSHFKSTYWVSWLRIATHTWMKCKPGYRGTVDLTSHYHQYGGLWTGWNIHWKRY